MSYLEEARGLDPDMAARYGVEVKTLRRGGEAVAIEYRRNGEFVGHKIRPLNPGEGDKRFFFHPSGKERDLWNVDVLGDDTLFDHPIIITEGELDALSCVAAGFPRAVSIPDGWTEKYEGGEGPKSKPILNNLDRLKRSPFVIVAGDDDPTGASFIRAARNMLDGHPVKYLTYPEGCKDANEVLAKYGPGELARVINSARWLDPAGGLVTGFSDMPPEPPMTILRPNLHRFDDVILFHVGFPTIITGIPSSGKSTFTVVALHHVIRSARQRDENVRVAVGMFETPTTILLDHLCRLSMGGRPWDTLAHPERRNLLADLDQSWRIIHRVDDDSGPHDMQWVRNMMWAAAVRDGCKIVVLDPWNEIEHIVARGESVTDYTNAALTYIRQWSERFGCATVILAHPTKMQAEAGTKPRAPLGYDINASAAWFNKAAIGVTVHRMPRATPHENPVKVINWKSKFQQQYGIEPGEVDLDFRPLSMTYDPRATPPPAAPRPRKSKSKPDEEDA